ncbi:TOBE domain-containing protein [Sulfurospirillum deleyianum]|uniref:TOBE domain protein n=1 Tax=Sulfurospirillum deleyianum (strain ATCC 51133 / DSM 6946 / 5175) TaxID=525898 RepID=D1B4R0_SULD5|nr:TOBE domain-containing protein [Sulfurospirillum deleyianum]ACZ13080.1 TOBE domain protein [Sulfurospirillum deleyianum DSM 6946]
MLEARLWMKKSNKNYLGKGRIELLERIREHGSIHAAAKAMKMSYKAAWDSVDAMNNLSETPLVEKISGGKGGGGTHLTAKGEEVIAAFHNLQVKHQQFLDLFGSSDNLATIVQTLNRLSLKLSARNQLIGTISAIRESPVNVQIELTIKAANKIYASITKNSYQELGLHLGDSAIAIIKASSIFLSKTKPTIACENLLQGKIIQILSDTSSTEITLELESKSTITATISNEAFEPLGLKINEETYIFFKASNVILGI